MKRDARPNASIVGPFWASQHGVPKADMLHRIASIVERLRLCSAYCGNELQADAARLEAALTAIEEAHAANVDTYQDGLYRRHNCPPVERDMHGVSRRTYHQRKGRDE